MKQPKDKRSLIISAVLLAVFTVIAVVSVIVIGSDTAGTVPNAVKLVLFLGGAAGFVISLAVFVTVLIKRSRKTPANQSVSWVFKKDVPTEEEKVRKEYERLYKNFWDNLVFPDGFCEFLDEYANGQNDKKVILSKEDPKDAYVEGINFFRLYNVCPSEKLKEYNDRAILRHKTRMYRNVVAFAEDGTGECLFFLDYEYGNEPLINVMNEKRNTGYYVAGSFSKFRQKLVTEKKANEIIGKDYYQ
ncbi:MAG: SMI1/KNR4 family protein [Clostridia bacterium]|nr:SMI1/KNR4 family protein [Clostridia bacterium]